ncbi:Sequestosome-1 [Oopsacas minuta]|uniref:Sequestosome-1 n=1 Tax=Oopsacas minuta TaxID=111878 RepID=A0AAV7K5Z2_9METZ|nr:Sequestosome-1 [Oopsacas minuta]
MNNIQDTKVEEFLKALSTAKQSLNRSEQILGVKSVLTDTEDILSNSPTSTTLDGLLKYDTPTHSYVTTSLASFHGDAQGMPNNRSPFDTYSMPLEPSELDTRHNLFQGVNGITIDPATSRLKNDILSLNSATQFVTDGEKGFREDSLDRRLGELREENNRLVDQSRRSQGIIDDLKLKLRTGTNKLEQSQSDLADELKQKTLLEDRVVSMESKIRAILQEFESQRSRTSDLELQLTERCKHVTNLESDLSTRSEEVKTLKRSYDTVSRTLEQTVSSQARLREALTQSKEREREGAMLSDERLAQLQSAESKLFNTQQQLEESKKSRFDLHSSPSNGLAVENVALKEKVSVLSKQASQFQLELTTARSQLKLMESLAVRLESPSPGIGAGTKYSSGSGERIKSELDNKDRQIRLLENQLTDKTRSSADHVEQLQQLHKQINNLRREKLKLSKIKSTNMSLIIKIFLIEDWNKEPSQIRRFAWDTGLRFAELCEKVLNLYPTLIGSDLILKWKDEEGDWIDISSDTELLDAAKAIEGQLLKLWVSTEKKPSEPKDPCMDWPRDWWCHRGGGRGAWRGCRKGFPGKEHKITHWGYVCDGCEGAIVGSRYNCRDCPNYDLCQGCFDQKLHKEHSFVEVRFPKKGRRGYSREMEKEFLESVGNGVAELLAPLDINVDVEIDERPTKQEEPMESKQEPQPEEPETEPETISEPTAPSQPVHPDPTLSHPPPQFVPSDVMPSPYFYQPMAPFPPFQHVHFPGHIPGVPPHHPHPHFFPPPQEYLFQIPEDMTPVQRKAMETLREMGFDISNSKLIEGVRKNGDNIQATVEEMLKK